MSSFSTSFFSADRETNQKDPAHSKSETSPLGEITVRCAESYGTSEADNSGTEESLLEARTNTHVSGRSMEAKDNLAPNALEENLWFGPSGLLACWRLRRIVYMEFIFMVRAAEQERVLSGVHCATVLYYVLELDWNQSFRGRPRPPRAKCEVKYHETPSTSASFTRHIIFFPRLIRRWPEVIHC